MTSTPTYSVNEVFYSLQGEGYWTGRASAFIRLSGCNLACPWCDTNHQHKFTADRYELATMLAPFGQHMANNKMVVITGGEPTLQDLHLLVLMLHSLGWYIALETNGTKPERIPREVDWVTVSPKAGVSYSGIKGQECKLILDGKINPNEFRQRFRSKFRHWFIQPCSQQYEQAVTFVKENPSWRLSLQTQKVINIL